MKNYQQNKITNSGKMVLLFKILEDSIKVGDKVLVFSQSLMTLSVIEKFLAMTPIPQPDNPPEDMPTKWVRNSTYFSKYKVLPFCHFCDTLPLIVQKLFV